MQDSKLYPVVEKNPNRHRLGRFMVSRPILENPLFPKLLAFFEMVVVRAESIYPDQMKYTGFCEAFRELEQSEILPVYEFHITETGEDPEDYKFTVREVAER